MTSVVLTICLGIQTVKAAAVTAVVWSGRQNMKGIVRRVSDGWAISEWCVVAGIATTLILL